MSVITDVRSSIIDGHVKKQKLFQFQWISVNDQSDHVTAQVKTIT